MSTLADAGFFLIVWLFFNILICVHSTPVVISPVFARLPANAVSSLSVSLNYSQESNHTLLIDSEVPFGFVLDPRVFLEAISFSGCEFALSAQCNDSTIYAPADLLSDFLDALVVNMGAQDGHIRFQIDGGTNSTTLLISVSTLVTSTSGVETALIGGLSAAIAIMVLISLASCILLYSRIRSLWTRWCGRKVL
jgi:hypothetical protein